MLLRLLLLLSACDADFQRHDPDLPEGDADTDSDGDTDADTDADTDSDADTDFELRGAWVTRWTYGSADDIERIMADLEAAGFNAVYFQVRGNFDAFYDSDLEPWSSILGSLGQDPGWDPLQEAVTRGHAHGLQVHAYLNTFPLWTGSTPPPETTPRHALLEHPDWLVADSEGPMELNASYVFASPGNPAVRAHIAAVAADIAGRYAVDGIHLDYIRYPGAQYSHDTTSEAQFASSGLSWAEWQRAQITATAQAVYDAVDVPVTAAVWGIYENDWGWSGVSQGNVDYYQDSRAMLAEGALDATLPMIYWPVTSTPGDRLDFATLVLDHVGHASGRHVYAGLSAELGLDEVLACVAASRAAGAQGVVLFDYSTARGEGWLQDLGDAVFAEPASPPPMTWR